MRRMSCRNDAARYSVPGCYRLWWLAPSSLQMPVFCPLGYRPPRHCAPRLLSIGLPAPSSLRDTKCRSNPCFFRMDCHARRLARNAAADIVCQAAIACGGSPLCHCECPSSVHWVTGPLVIAPPVLCHCERSEAIHAFLEWIATLAGWQSTRLHSSHPSLSSAVFGLK